MARKSHRERGDVQVAPSEKFFSWWWVRENWTGCACRQRWPSQGTRCEDCQRKSGEQRGDGRLQRNGTQSGKRVDDRGIGVSWKDWSGDERTERMAVKQWNKCKMHEYNGGWVVSLNHTGRREKVKRGERGKKDHRKSMKQEGA